MTAPRRGARRAVQVIGRYTINPVAIGLARLGISLPGIWTPDSGLVLITVGRKSGKRRATPMGYLRESPGLLLVVAEHGRHADWVKNSLAAGEVTVVLGRLRHRARVQTRDDLEPDSVLRRMRPLHALGVRRLAFEPKVIELEIL